MAHQFPFEKARLRNYKSDDVNYQINANNALHRFPHLEDLEGYINLTDFLSLLECVGQGIRLRHYIQHDQNIPHENIADEGYDTDADDNISDGGSSSSMSDDD